MIVFDLNCDGGHRFEGWFGSSGDFAQQQEHGLVSCPSCGSRSVAKAPMAPAVPRKGGRGEAVRPTAPGAQTPPARGGPAAMARGPLPPEVANAMAKLAQVQREALRNSRWVGKDFAETSRAMHYGDRSEETIHGQASLEEARSLIEEGIPIATLPFPVAPPDEIN